LFKKPLINNRIRASKVRLIDAGGEQKGVVSIEEALRLSQERNLDLIQVTEKLDPPVCKIMDYGKYLYNQEKKQKKNKKTSVLKIVRIGFNISSHDLETKAKQVEKFLTKGDMVKIEMRLRGREKALKGHAEEKINEFLEIIKERIPFRSEKGLQKRGGNLSMIILKD
jgi:translation initiation factor IF-3